MGLPPCHHQRHCCYLFPFLSSTNWHVHMPSTLGMPRGSSKTPNPGVPRLISTFETPGFTFWWSSLSSGFLFQPQGTPGFILTTDISKKRAKMPSYKAYFLFFLKYTKHIWPLICLSAVRVALICLYMLLVCMYSIEWHKMIKHIHINGALVASTNKLESF